MSQTRRIAKKQEERKGDDAAVANATDWMLGKSRIFGSCNMHMIHINKMYFAPPIDYDKVMKKVPYGKVITVGKIREHFAKLSGADFTEPITAGIFVSIVAWASYQRSEDETPYWRTLKANGELNAKYPNGIEAQKEKLEAEGHTIIQKGRKNIRYYVKDYENSLFDLK